MVKKGIQNRDGRRMALKMHFDAFVFPSSGLSALGAA